MVTEYEDKRTRLANALCEIATGLPLDEVEPDTRTNYLLDAQDVIKEMPHLLTLAEGERLGLITD